MAELDSEDTVPTPPPAFVVGVVLPDENNVKLVTIKLPRNPQHDPQNKVTGECIMSPECTDSTGEHHSGLMYVYEIEELRKRGIHITRIESI